METGPTSRMRAHFWLRNKLLPAKGVLSLIACLHQLTSLDSEAPDVACGDEAVDIAPEQ